MANDGERRKKEQLREKFINDRNRNDESKYILNKNCLRYRMAEGMKSDKKSVEGKIHQG
jgi:hypothetical protein